MEQFSPESIEANPRAFWRSELARYLDKIKDLMAMKNREVAFYGQSPAQETMLRIVNWQRADKRGDYETASFGEWLLILDFADDLVDEWRALKYYGARRERPQYAVMEFER